MLEIGNPHLNKIKEHKELKKAQILNSFKEESDHSAKVITKQDFETQYPESQYERYSLASIHKFREDIMKAEDISDKDDAFKQATKDLKHFVVHNQGQKAIIFVRKKEVGE